MNASVAAGESGQGADIKISAAPAFPPKRGTHAKKESAALSSDTIQEYPFVPPPVITPVCLKPALTVDSQPR
jgi:hypothetical protein